MIKSAFKLGFIGALTYALGRAFYSLLSLLAVIIGSVVILACFFTWFYFSVTNGWLVIG